VITEKKTEHAPKAEGSARNYYESVQVCADQEVQWKFAYNEKHERFVRGYVIVTKR